MGLLVQESYLNRTENYTFGESDVYESFADTPGELYHSAVSEYGRCTGKVYVDGSDGPIHVGWTFVKRDHYEDARDTYLREVWVTIHDAQPTRTTEHHFHAIK